MQSRLAAGLDAPTSFPKAIWAVGSVLFLIALLGPNTTLAVLATAVLIFGTGLLWRPGEAPILLVIFLYQWLQISISTYYGNLKGIGVNQLTTVAPASDVELATLLSEIALVALAIGMRAGAGPSNPNDALRIRRAASIGEAGHFFRLYLISFVIAFFSEAFAFRLAGLSQVLLTVTYVKWAFFFILGYTTFSTKDKKIYFFFAFFLELLWGFGGYFSDFKSVFIFTLMSVAASKARVSASAIVPLGALVSFLAIFTLAWTAVKGEYRNYLSGGEQAQIVTVGYTDRSSKLLELISNLTSDDLEAASDQMISRIAYVQVFGAVLNYVPAIEPFADGSLWLDAVARPFMPRLFFPEKGAIITPSGPISTRDLMSRGPTKEHRSVSGILASPISISAR